MKDYYTVLGVPHNATATEIKQAYRRLIKGCHPDVNSSPKAVEWARELNEAYDVLSNAQARMSYDMNWKVEESQKEDSSSKHASGGATSSRTRTEDRQPPRAETNFCCETCGRVDSSLRISAIWRVHSFINYSKKFPSVKILCNRCRLKQSLAANAYCFFLGWWSFFGIFWTLEALIHNANGGEQPEENNEALLKALGYQLFRAGRLQEAFNALNASLRIKPDPQSEQARDYLKQQFQPTPQKTFWARCRNLELHPSLYHVPVGVAVIALVIFGFRVSNETSNSDSRNTAQQQSVASPEPTHSAIALQPPKQPEPVFSEPELPLPENSSLLFGDSFVTNTGTTAPFKLTTPSDGNYVMKIEDWDTKEFVAMYFIQRSSTLTIELPLGSYRLKFAQGDKWYGTKFLFGPQTAYSFVPDKMDFYISGDYARGHEIQLIPQANGNLTTPPMRATDW